MGVKTRLKVNKEKVLLNDVFEKYIPKFEYELVDLNKYQKEDLLNLENLLSLILLIDKIKSANDFKLLKEIPKRYIEKVIKDTPNELLIMLARIIKDFLERVNTPENEIDNIVEQIYERRFIEMFTMLEAYDVQATRREEGREKGKEEGREKGKEEEKIEIVKNMLEENMPLQIISRFTGLSIEIIQELTDTSKDISTNPYE